tara:strand:+ start:945 stop:1844 length:900 start_codon:yes stop_codon:yes gene_type:complete
MKKYFCEEKVTIGVAAYGNLMATKNCIEAIKKSIDGNYEVILVDDCSPGNGEIKNFFLDLKKEFAHIKVFHFPENLGYVESVNCILSNSSSNKTIFVSNDIYINPYFIEELINISDIEDKIGYVRGVSNFVDNNMATHNINFKNKTHFNPNEIAKKIFLKEKNNFIEDSYLVGDCFLVNTKLLEKIGYFDCYNFKDYFGDVDFSFRAKAMDFKCVLSKGAFCVHHQHTNFDYLSKEERIEKMKRRKYFIAEDWARFKLKYKFPNNLVFPGINELNFDEIKNKVDKKKVVEKKDYSQYFI